LPSENLKKFWGEKMPLEIKGTRLRYRVRNPIKGAIFRTDDIGQKGHSLRVAQYNPRTKRWQTQSWTFPIIDIKEKRPATIKILEKLGIKKKALAKVI
jgi:hypothetical protein